MAALAPIPSASVRTTVKVRPFARSSDRSANFRSVIRFMVSSGLPPRHRHPAPPHCSSPSTEARDYGPDLRQLERRASSCNQTTMRLFRSRSWQRNGLPGRRALLPAVVGQRPLIRSVELHDEQLAVRLWDIRHWRFVLETKARTAEQ